MKFASLWINKDNNNHKLPPIIEMCLKSFVRHGHEFYLFSYDHDLEIPEGIKLCDANMIMELDKLMLYAEYKSPENEKFCQIANFSDRFRWNLLYMFPNMCWVDTDIYLIKPVSELEKYLTNGNISVVKYNNTKFFKTLYDYAEDPCIILPFDGEERIKYKIYVKRKTPNISKRPLKFEWGYAGINTMGKLMTHLNIESDDIELFYPVKCECFNQIFFGEYGDKTLTEIFPNSYGIHLWNGMIAKYNWPIKCVKDSIFSKMLDETFKTE